MAKKKTSAFSAELLDELLKDQDPAAVLQSNCVFRTNVTAHFGRT